MSIEYLPKEPWENHYHRVLWYTIPEREMIITGILNW